MSFSRLLLIAANSKKCIRGKGNGKVCISPKLSKSDRDPMKVKSSSASNSMIKLTKENEYLTA